MILYDFKESLKKKSDVCLALTSAAAGWEDANRIKKERQEVANKILIELKK